MIKLLKSLLAKLGLYIEPEEKPDVYWFLNGYGRVRLAGCNYVPTVGELIFLNFTIGHITSRVCVVVAVKPTMSIAESGFLGHIKSIKVSEIEVVLEQVTDSTIGTTAKVVSANE